MGGRRPARAARVARARLALRVARAPLLLAGDVHLASEVGLLLGFVARLLVRVGPLRRLRLPLAQAGHLARRRVAPLAEVLVAVAGHRSEGTGQPV